MPLVSPLEILQDGRRRGYGIGNLMGSDLGMVIGLVRAAEELNSPVLLVYNQEVNPRIPIEFGLPMIVNAARQANSPVGVGLDHGYDLGIICKAIDLGANMVMFDGSRLPYEQNVSRTREVVEYAHARGVAVEGELGSISGSVDSQERSSRDAVYTDPLAAVDFVEKTGIDFLAISFGNVHGVYHGTPQLDLDRVRAIFNQVDLPLVMHGASGLDFGCYPEIIKAGITKVNYYTAMARSAAAEILKCLQAKGENLAYHDLITSSVDAHYRAGKQIMQLFGSAGKAG